MGGQSQCGDQTSEAVEALGTTTALLPYRRIRLSPPPHHRHSSHDLLSSHPHSAVNVNADTRPTQHLFSPFSSMSNSTQTASSDSVSTQPPASSSPPLPPLASLSSNPKLVRFIEDRTSLLSTSSYYEVLQLYKSQIHRANLRHDPTTASLLALDGATTLLSHQQGNAGGELALSLIDLYTKQHLTPTPSLLSSLLSLFWAFPPDARTSRLTFMKAAVKWSVGAAHKRGHPDLHLSLARFYASLIPQVGRDYATSHLHYLASPSASIEAGGYGVDIPRGYDPPPPPTPSATKEFNTYAEHAALLLEWSSKGFPSERPLFICRCVLQYLAYGDLKGAHAVLDGVMTRLPSGVSAEVSADPLIHFLQFVLKTCEKEAGELFDVLREKYAPALQRDEALQGWLDRIGEVFFHREVKKSWLDNLLG